MATDKSVFLDSFLFFGCSRKIDIRLLLILGGTYAISLIDRTNISIARTVGMGKDLALTVGARYSIITLWVGQLLVRCWISADIDLDRVFFIPYIIVSNFPVIKLSFEAKLIPLKNSLNYQQRFCWERWELDTSWLWLWLDGEVLWLVSKKMQTNFSISDPNSIRNGLYSKLGSTSSLSNYSWILWSRVRTILLKSHCLG